VHVASNSQHVERSSSSSAINALSKRPCYALIMHPSPNFRVSGRRNRWLGFDISSFRRFVVLELVLEIEVWLEDNAMR